ncbi:hypothetical protein ACVWZ7_000451 [Arthrobacter sp. TE12232]
MITLHMGRRGCETYAIGSNGVGNFLVHDTNAQTISLLRALDRY